MCKCRSHGNLSPLRPSKFSFEYLLLPPRSAPTAAPPGLTPRVLRRPPRPPTHRGMALAPTAGYRLLGPCFKTGRIGSPQADARSTLVPKHAETARAGFHDRGDDVSTAYQRPWLGPPPRSTSVHAPRPIGRTGSRRSTSDRGASPAPIRFPPDNFKHSLTLFSKSFSSFPRGTCSLSVSRPYLALDGIYRPIRAAFPNNPTRRQRLVVRQGPGHDGALTPLRRPFPGDLGPVRRLRTLLQTTIRTPRATDSQAGLFPAGFDNDPSAGSPTETLLRLLLPLNDKVQWTSRDVAGSEPPTSPRSEHFTGPFNHRAGGTTRPIKARSASPAVGTSRPVLTVRRTGRPTPRSNYELFNCNNLNIRYWSWNYRGCWHQTCPPMDPR
ncbi:hypothetical protein V6N13_030204 [Hibiscus sabdariffa]